MDNNRPKDWHELCKAVANELDPAKLMHLINELTRALDERDQKRNSAQQASDDKTDGAGRWQSEPAT